MPFDIEKIQKATRSVTKFLRKNSKRPRSGAIHKLRTSARTLQTTFTTLRLDAKGNAKRSLRELEGVRRRAGKIRDMDVLTADVLTVKKEGEQDCVVQVLEHLGAQRNRCAKKLRRVIKNTPHLRQDLKRTYKHVEKLLGRAETNPADSDAIPATMAKAIQLSSELNRPLRFTKKNFHPYRLKVKELLNVLQLSDRTADLEFLKKLREVKDAIGDWHDWEELIAIAAELLNHRRPCKLMMHLRATSKSKYEHALLLTSQLRSKFLKPGGIKRKRGHSKGGSLSAPVLSATAAIAEP